MKTAAVTGAASGIGRRAVERLIDAGWSVWAIDRSAEGLQAHAQVLRAGERLHSVVCDVSSAESVAAAFRKIASRTQQLDALICSAGILRVGRMEEACVEDIDAMLNVNVKGPWLCGRAALTLLRQGAHVEAPSRIVIVGSIGGIRPKAGAGFYGASKAAIHVVAGVMAVELAPSGVTVNVVAPGTVNTPMVAAAVQGGTRTDYRPSGESPLGRVAEPDDVVDVIEFFLSDAARQRRGVAGGWRNARSVHQEVAGLFARESAEPARRCAVPSRRRHRRADSGPAHSVANELHVEEAGLPLQGSADSLPRFCLAASGLHSYNSSSLDSRYCWPLTDP
ncbi:MAG: SDR family oxidoreductase [Burkholderiales bacterium]|nr:MAG: SDR family oxidoreductase [Burkholderiales bacterium]